MNQVTWVDANRGNDANAGTEQAPLQTLAKAVQATPAGGAIFLRPGTYSSNLLKGGSNRPYWTTIESAPGGDRGQVEIGAGRPGTQRLHFKNVTLFCDVPKGYGTILAGENGKHVVWLDNCKCYNKKGRWAGGTSTFGNRYESYITGGVTTEMGNGPGGSLIHNHFVNAKQPMGSDVTTGNPFYLEPVKKDYSIQTNSPAWGNGYHLQCVPADIDGTPCPANGRNRGCYARPGARKL